RSSAFFSDGSSGVIAPPSDAKSTSSARRSGRSARRTRRLSPFGGGSIRLLLCGVLPDASRRRRQLGTWRPHAKRESQPLQRNQPEAAACRIPWYQRGEGLAISKRPLRGPLDSA